MDLKEHVSTGIAVEHELPLPIIPQGHKCQSRPRFRVEPNTFCFHLVVLQHLTKHVTGLVVSNLETPKLTSTLCSNSGTSPQMTSFIQNQSCWIFDAVKINQHADGTPWPRMQHCRQASHAIPHATFAAAPPRAFLNAGASARERPPTVGTKSMRRSPKHTTNSLLPLTAGNQNMHIRTWMLANLRDTEGYRGYRKVIAHLQQW
jgi:hypothetical protein